MSNVLITGANGMIGNLILGQCLEADDVDKVTIIVRRTLGLRHPKLIEIIHNNFLDYSAIQENLKDQQVCFFCIGVYTGQVPRNEFIEITVDYTRAFALALREQNDRTSFCFLSGDGADSSEKSPILFAKYKGIAENALLALKFTATHIFRPGYIYPVKPRKEPHLGYRFMRWIYKPLSFIYPNIGLTSTQLAASMVKTGLNGGSKTFYSNRDIRKMK